MFCNWATHDSIKCFCVNKIFVSNWAGSKVTDSLRSTAGVPWGLAYTDSLTGATKSGTVSVFNIHGDFIKEITVGLHPNAIIRYHASDMILHVDTNAVYLVLPKGRNRCA